MISYMYNALEATIKSTLSTWKVYNVTGVSTDEFIDQYATENQAVCVSYRGFSDNSKHENRTSAQRSHDFYITIIANTDIINTIESVISSFDVEELKYTDDDDNTYYYNFDLTGGDFSTYYGGNIFEMRVSIYA